MKKLSFYKEEHAIKEANELATEASGYIEETSYLCEDLPCPTELPSWSGEISAYAVYDKNDNRIAIIGYWE